jgi:hypothetical protein
MWSNAGRLPIPANRHARLMGWCAAGALLATGMLWLLAPSAWKIATTKFWLGDLPPMHGVLRILVYGGLLLLMFPWQKLGGSPLQAPETWRWTAREFYTPIGLNRQIGTRWHTYERLRLLRAVVMVSWVCCILGFGGPLPPVLTGVGVLVLNGVAQGAIGTCHRWYMPTYTLLALALSDGRSTHSLDALLLDAWADYPFPTLAAESSPVLLSGLARKLVLVSGIFTLTSGGLAKLRNGGFKWMSGSTLGFHMRAMKPARWPALRTWLAGSPRALMLLSVWVVAFELAAVVAVWDADWRPAILAVAVGLHIGIGLVMSPNYTPQSFCYVLALAWPWLSVAEVPPPASQWLAGGLTVTLAVWLSSAFVVFLALVSLLRIEYWPFTYIPMYSRYRAPGEHSRHIRDARAALVHALDQSGHDQPLIQQWFSLRILDASVAGREVSIEDLATTRQLDPGIPEHLAIHGVFRNQWLKVICGVGTVDIGAKFLHRRGAGARLPETHAKAVELLREGDDLDYPAEAWLASIAPRLRAQTWTAALPDWVEHSGVLQLCVRVADVHAEGGTQLVPLAEVAWNPGTRAG